MSLKIKISPCEDGSYELEIPDGLTIDCNHWWHDVKDPDYKDVKPPPENTVFPHKLNINFIESPNPQVDFSRLVSFPATQKKAR